jgi:hypothetical protein
MSAFSNGTTLSNFTLRGPPYWENGRSFITVRLRVNGPTEVETIAKQHVNDCIAYGLNHASTKHALEIMIGLGADIWAGTQGAATTAALSDYVTDFAKNTASCLTDEDKIQEVIERSFHATVKAESDWVYWDM